MKIRIGIICPSEIAFRRFLPALQKNEHFLFVGVAVANKQEFQGATDEVLQKEKTKAQSFVDAYGGSIFDGYLNMIASDQIDAVYLPLPPALHYFWAKKALEYGKHVMVEKPSTCFLCHTQDLVDTARLAGLALHENYMFVFHNQIAVLKDLVQKDEKIGTPWLYRISFGFPRRAPNDFRYNKKLGGGALLDAGGYTLRYATEILGPTAKVVAANVNYSPDFEVEVFGTATLVNDAGLTVQTAFGMDNDYHCDLEVWGSKGTLSTGRILTAPVGCVPSYTLKVNQDYSQHSLPEDDAFFKSLQRFASCVENKEVREDNYNVIVKQETLVQQFREISGLTK